MSVWKSNRETSRASVGRHHPASGRVRHCGEWLSGRVRFLLSRFARWEFSANALLLAEIIETVRGFILFLISLTGRLLMFANWILGSVPALLFVVAFGSVVQAAPKGDDCVARCKACAEACKKCAADCEKDNPGCAKMCTACHHLCTACAALDGTSSEDAVRAACAKVCTECAAVCAKGKDASCRECAKACKACAEACKQG